MDGLEDALWYRVRQLRPRLRVRVRVQRRIMRGAVWYVLIDDESRRYHRVDAAAYQIVGRLDGEVSVDEAWRAAHQRLGEAAPTQSETLRILSQLSDAELLNLQTHADAGALVKRRKERQRGLRSAVANPLSFKLPLFDPTRWLRGLRPVARGLFSGWGLLAWSALVLAALALALARGDALHHALAQRAHSGGFLLEMWALYAMVKVVHEACHALAVWRWGGAVHEVGLNLVMFNPLPYVDASAANGFARRGARMTVSAAGVMAELALAALAVFVWNAASGGGVQTAALAVLAACGVSTLVFNANPLARFDGYYLLCDGLDLPNLQPRGRAVLQHLVQRATGALPAGSPSPEATRGTAALVASYAVLSWLYQAVVVATIAYWLYQPYAVLAWAVLLYGAWTMLGRPLSRAAVALLSDSRYNGRRVRVVGVSASLVALASGAFFFLPVASFSVQQGVVWATPEATLRAEAPGELVTLAATPNQRVTAGQHVALLDNLELRSERESVQSKWQQLDLQYFNALLSDPLEARRVALERDALQARLDRIAHELAAMDVHAGLAGQLILPKETAQPGHVFRRGDEFGYILSERSGMLVKVALSESQAALMRQSVSRISVRLAAAPQHELAATLDRETPGATRTLPSAVLGTTAGGPIATDPEDASGRQTLASVVVIDVRVPDQRAQLIGAKAWVRIDHPPEPLAQQWAREFKQAFLARLATRT